MSKGSFEVYTKALHGHCTAINNISKGISESISAIETTLDMKAFGVVGMAIPETVLGTAREAATAAKKTAGAVEMMSGGVKAMAEDFERLDQGATDAIKKLAGNLKRK